MEYRRHLPHIVPEGRPIFVTFRLHGSLPAGRDFQKGKMSDGRVFVAMDRLLHKDTAGPLYLRKPEIADVVVEELHVGVDRQQYDLHAWVVMPNHVHMLVSPHVRVPSLLQTLKGRTARRANGLLHRTGAFWQPESYDHLVRNADEFDRIAKYIHNNPVHAGILHDAAAYQRSSAYISQ